MIRVGCRIWANQSASRSFALSSTSDFDALVVVVVVVREAVFLSFLLLSSRDSTTSGPFIRTRSKTTHPRMPFQFHCISVAGRGLFFDCGRRVCAAATHACWFETDHLSVAVVEDAGPLRQRLPGASIWRLAQAVKSCHIHTRRCGGNVGVARSICRRTAHARGGGRTDERPLGV